MPAAQTPVKHRYIVIEYETQLDWPSMKEAVNVAISQHEQDRSKGYAVVELLSIISSEHKTVVEHLFRRRS